ncbi:MAG: fibronectin type III domain-containing protein [Bacteroidales bacterium]|nr:fibronectin type III domain-containing protein [Bacteroidales bacterium]
MKKFTLLTGLFLLTFIYLFAQKGYINPAANFCKMMGYQYELSLDNEGNQIGICTLPDGSKVNAWDFYNGKVGNEFSYGAKFGFNTETEIVKLDGYVIERAVCITMDKGEKIRIPMLELMEVNGEALINYEKQEIFDIHEDVKADPNFKSTKSLPVSFDWRNKDGHAYIGAVRNQGGCGSCYAFGAAAAAEATYNFATNNYDGNCADFSESYIAWCLGSMSPYSSHFSGCGGADYDYQELQALVDIGICDESYFPYTDADNQSCAPAAESAPKTQFENWYRVPCADVDAIKTAIMTYGVVDAAVYVTTPFSNYSGGIFTDNYNTCNGNPCYNTTTNHAISLVGWGHDASEGDYWILRNSWGPSWGEDGYMRMAVTAAHIDCSVCYMVYDINQTTRPTLTTSNVSSIGDNTATCGGNITDNGGETVTVSGIVYSLSENPTVGDAASVTIETSPVIKSGSFSLNMTELASGTTYYVRSFATNLKGTAYGENKVFTTTGDPQITYCTSQGDNCSYEWIAEVQIGGFVNSSGAASYTDFTLTNIELTAGNNYAISLTPGFSSTTYDEYWKIWIDYNDDGDFEDIDELAFDAGSMSKTVVTGNISIPTDGNGSHRMRVSMKYNGAQTSCESFSYGEVEDYTVNISGGDTEPPTAPSNLSASNITQTTVDLTWNASTDNVGVTGYIIYKDGVSNGTSTSTSYTATGLSAVTSYTFTVKAKDAAGNISDVSNAVNITTIDEEAPSAPSSLTASNITQTTVDLTWNASTDNIGVTGYMVYKGAALIANTTNTNYSVSGLTASTSYTFTVKAKDAAGNISDASNTANVTTLNIPDTEAPTAPSNLTASNITQNTVDLSWNASSDNIGVTEYMVYRGTTLIGNPTGTNYTATGLSASTLYTFTVKAKDAAGNISNASNAVNATTLEESISYCSLQGNSVTFEWIDLVELGTISNSTGSDGGYGDYTNLVTSIDQGGSYTIYFSTGFKSKLYTEYWKIWIDFNHDGDFEDSGELVISGSTSDDQVYSATINVPSDASIGNTRMRVAMSDNSSYSSCGSFRYGEVEDYTVSINGGVPDTEAPTAPGSLTALNIAQTTVDLSWNASTDNVGVTEYMVYQGATLIGNPTGTNYTVTGLSALTSYNFTVKAKDAAGNISNASNTVNITTLEESISYCALQGNSVNFEWIDLVELGTISNSTGKDGGYGDYTNLATSIEQGGSHTIYFSTGYKGKFYTEYWKIWIDFNHDGDFEDSGELVVSGSSNDDQVYSATINVPSDASIGSTRMRVAMSDNSSFSSCGSFRYGEVEDYTVNISAKSRFANNTSHDANELSSFETDNNKFIVYPNPANDIININTNGYCDNFPIKIISINGTVVMEGFINEDMKELNISEIPSGIYMILIDNEKNIETLRFIKQ